MGNGECLPENCDVEQQWQSERATEQKQRRNKWISWNRWGENQDWWDMRMFT